MFTGVHDTATPEEHDTTSRSPDEETTCLIDKSPAVQHPSPLWRLCRLLLGSPVPLVGIDTSPKYSPNGDRHWLIYQRAPTRRERWWIILTAPMVAWRSRNFPSDPIEMLKQAPFLPDPTVIIPTGEVLSELHHTFDQEHVSQRLRRMEERKSALAEENRIWMAKSRGERLSSMDRRPLWCAEGYRIMLYQRCVPLWWEEILFLLTLPVMSFRALRSFMTVFREFASAKIENSSEVVGSLDDWTVIWPTGEKLWLDSELTEEQPEARPGDRVSYTTLAKKVEEA